MIGWNTQTFFNLCSVFKDACSTGAMGAIAPTFKSRGQRKLHLSFPVSLLIVIANLYFNVTVNAIYI